MFLLVAYLLLIGAGNQPAELAQTVVDPVTPPFLNNLEREIDVISLFSQ